MDRTYLSVSCDLLSSAASTVHLRQDTLEMPANGFCVQKRFWLVVSGMTNLCQESGRQGKVLCVVISAEDATLESCVHRNNVG